MSNLFTDEQVKGLGIGDVIVVEETYFGEIHTTEYLVCHCFEEIDEYNAYRFQLVNLNDVSVTDIKGVGRIHLIEELELELEDLDVTVSIKKEVF